MFFLSEVKEAIRDGYWPPESSKLPGPLPELSPETINNLDDVELNSYLEELARKWAGENGVELH